MRTPQRPAVRKKRATTRVNHAKQTYEAMPDHIEIHKNAVEYSKQATQYMFYANGTALTTLLLNFEVGKYYIPMLVFGFGVVLSIMIPFVFYIRCSASISEPIPGGMTALAFWHKNCLLRYFGIFSMWFPPLLFLYGLCATADCFNDGFPR